MATPQTCYTWIPHQERHGWTLKLKDYRAITRPSVRTKAKAYPFSLITNLPVLLSKKKYPQKSASISSAKLHRCIFQQPKSIHSHTIQAYQLVLIEGLSLLQSIFVVFQFELQENLKSVFILISNAKNEWSILLLKSAYCSKTVILLPPLTFRRRTQI